MPIEAKRPPEAPKANMSRVAAKVKSLVWLVFLSLCLCASMLLSFHFGQRSSTQAGDVVKQAMRIAELEEQLATGQAGPTPEPAAPAAVASPTGPLMKKHILFEQNSATLWETKVWARNQRSFDKKGFAKTSVPLVAFVKTISDPTILEVMAAYKCTEGDVDVFTSPDTDNPMSVAVLPCTATTTNYGVVIKVTSAGATPIYNPESYGFMYASGRVLGVSDVDANGHLEIWVTGTVYEGDDSEESQDIPSDGVAALEEHLLLGSLQPYFGGGGGYSTLNYEQLFADPATVTWPPPSRPCVYEMGGAPIDFVVDVELTVKTAWWKAAGSAPTIRNGARAPGSMYVWSA